MSLGAAGIARLGELFEYREGLHLKDSLLWFDAQVGRELSFIAHAMVPGALRHRKVVISSAAAALLEATAVASGGTRSRRPQMLITPYERPFFLGELRLELFPSGFALGSASLLVQVGSHRIVYAGQISTELLPLAQRLEARHCEVLVVPNGPGAFEQRSVTRSGVERSIVRFVEESFESRQVPLLMCSDQGIVAHVAYVLAEKGISLKAHGKVLSALKVHGAEGVLDLSRIRRYRGSLEMHRRPEALLWPLSLMASPTVARLSRARTAVVSAGDATDDQLKKAAAVFRLNLQADLKGLSEYVRACHPELVILVGGDAECPAATRLRQDGIDVISIGHEPQLDLFH